MITVHDLHKTYGSKVVLSGVSASFPRGQLTSLIGPNGAGKTTLLMMLARLLAPGSGDIRLHGQSIDNIAIGDYARRVATLRQSVDFNLRLTVDELVAFGRFPYSRGAPPLQTVGPSTRPLPFCPWSRCARLISMNSAAASGKWPFWP